MSIRQNSAVPLFLDSNFKYFQNSKSFAYFIKKRICGNLNHFYCFFNIYRLKFFVQDFVFKLFYIQIRESGFEAFQKRDLPPFFRSRSYICSLTLVIRTIVFRFHTLFDLT